MRERSFKITCFMLLGVSVLIAEPIIEAPDLIVTPTRTPVAIADVPAAINLVPAVALELQAPLTIDAALRGLPGIDVQGSDAPADGVKVNMRGLTSGFQTKRVLVLQDGRRINEQYQGNAEFMTLPANHVDRIEVVRGPGSALYGSGAMGGVIQIFTKQGASPVETAVSASYGSYHTRKYTIRHGSAHAGFDYAISGGWMETDGWLTRRDGTDMHWRAANFDANMGWQLSEDTALRLFTGAYRGDGLEFNNDRNARKDYQMLVLNQDMPTANDASFTLRFYRNGQRDVYDWLYPGEGRYDQQTLAAEAIYSFWIGSAHRLTIGTEARREAVDVREVTDTLDEKSDVLAVFAQDEWYVTDRLRIQTGLRVDDNQDYDTTWSPRLAALFRVNAEAEFYASYNRAHRAPALADRFASAVFFNMLFVGNPDLKPETLDAYEIGFRYRPHQRIQTAAALFWNEMNDSFESVYVPELDARRPENISNTRTYGSELEVRAQLSKQLTAFTSYTYTEGEYTSDPRPSVQGNRVAYLAKHKARAGLVLDAGRAGLHEVMAIYTGDRYADVANNTKLDTYTVAHWSSRIAVAPHTWVGLNINNIADAGYRHFEPYKQPGRSIMGTMELRF